MSNKINIKEVEKHLIEYGFNSTIETINRLHGMQPPCILFIKDHLADNYTEIHTHEVYEVMYIEYGSFKFLIEDQEFELDSGDILLIPPYIKHKILEISTKPAKRVILIFPKTYLMQFNTQFTDISILFDKVRELKNFKIKVRPAFKARITSSMNMLEELYLSHDFGDDVIFNATFSSLIARMYKGINFYDLEKSFVTHSVIIKKVNNYINDNIDKKILIKDLADYVGLSESRISHIYKNHMGISINQYIIKKRLTIAKDMLKIGITLSDITIKCGFQDYSSFLRSFKKEYGISPKAYQNQYYKD